MSSNQRPPISRINFLRKSCGLTCNNNNPKWCNDNVRRKSNLMKGFDIKFPGDVLFKCLPAYWNQNSHAAIAINALRCCSANYYNY